jgi:hypothetical protein
MSTDLATYKASRGNTEYIITEGNDGVVYCTCPGWKFKKNCKHLLDWQLNGGAGAARTLVPPALAAEAHDKATEHFDDDAKLNAALNTAVNMLKG